MYRSYRFLSLRQKAQVVIRWTKISPKSDITSSLARDFTLRHDEAISTQLGLSKQNANLVPETELVRHMGAIETWITHKST